MTPQDFQQVATAYKNVKDNQAGYSKLNRVGQGLKQSEPLSERLNKFIEDRFNLYNRIYNIVFVDTDDFDEDDIEGTFQKHVERFVNSGTIHIWTGASDNTIFGDPKINHYFRVWHDVEHLLNRLGYSYLDESIVCEIQKSQLPRHWVYEKELIHAEITGQAQYNMKTGEFVKDQRIFTKAYINNPAIITKLTF